MNTKSKMMISAIAMALMLGCALVPFVPNDSEIVAANDAQTDSAENFTISEILDSLLNIGEPGLLEETGYFFMPVESSGSEPRVIDDENDIDTAITVTDTVTFENNGNYNFTNDGQLIIGSTGTLVLFPLEEGNVHFSLTNNTSAINDLIVMGAGSKISIFDMTFQLIGTRDTPFSVISTETDNIECGFTFNLDASGHSEFRVNATDSMITVAELIKFDVTLYGRDIIVASGNLMPASEGTGIVFSGSVSLQELREMEIWNYPLSIMFKVSNFSFSYVPNSSGADVKLSASVSTNNDIRLLNNRVSLRGFALEIDDVAVKLAYNAGTISVKIDSPCSASLRFGNGSSFNERIADFKVAINASDLIIGLSIDEGSTEYGFDGNSLSMNKKELDGKLSVTFVDMNIMASYKSYDVAVCVTGNLNLDSIHLDYTDGENWSIKIGQTTSSDTLSSMEMGYSFPNPKEIGLNQLRIASPELLYGIESTTEITNVEIAKKGDTITIKFEELESDFATTSGSAEWKGKIAINDLAISGTIIPDPESNEETPLSIEIEKISVINNIPMRQLFSDPTIQSTPRVDIPIPSGVLCIPALDLELNNFSVESSSISFSSGYFNVKDYRGVDEFRVEFDENVTVAVPPTEEDPTSYSISFSTSGISGMVKNNSNQNDFSIDSKSNGSVAIAFKLGFMMDEGASSIEDKIKIDIGLEIISGIAEFKGGSLPFGIIVDSGVDFSANDLTAFGFMFDDGCSMDGTVSIDTDASLPLFYDKDKRAIKIGEDYALIPADNGYVMTLDLSTKARGTLVANDGYKLPRSFEEGGFSMESGDQKTGTFEVAATGATVLMECTGEMYRLTCEGTSESSLYEYGTPITLSMAGPVKRNLDFYGWSDGTVIYRPFETFVMPSHDVVLKPVYVKNVTPDRIKEGSRTVLTAYAPEADTIRLNIADIQWDILRVTVGNTTFVIDEALFAKQCCDEKGTVIKKKSIIFQSLATNPVVNSEGKSGNTAYYDFRFYSIDKDALTTKDIMDPFKCSEKTLFDTTVNMKVNGNLRDFKVYEVDYKGNLVPVDGVTYTKCFDGTYDVNFTINHAACYAIEPICDNTQYGAIVGIAIVLICAVGIGLYWTGRNRA